MGDPDALLATIRAQLQAFYALPPSPDFSVVALADAVSDLDGLMARGLWPKAWSFPACDGSRRGGQAVSPHGSGASSFDGSVGGYPRGGPSLVPRSLGPPKPSSGREVDQ